MSTPDSTLPQRKSSSPLLFLILFVLLGADLYRQFMPPRWDYTIKSVSDQRFVQEMLEMGSDGWELVSARRATSDTENPAPSTFSYEIIFKRRRIF